MDWPPRSAPSAFVADVLWRPARAALSLGACSTRLGGATGVDLPMRRIWPSRPISNGGGGARGSRSRLAVASAVRLGDRMAHPHARLYGRDGRLHRDPGRPAFRDAPRRLLAALDVL